MGGNALKNTVTRRYNKEEYPYLANAVMQTLMETFGIDVRFDTIASYRDKESYGDMDVLIMSDNLPTDWVQMVLDAFKPNEYVKNGNCLSFDYREFQIDLIATPMEDYYSSLQYFAYNDLGNLLGRVAHSLGLKLGHDGLSYNFRDGTNLYKNIPIYKSFDKILPLLGYSYERWDQGFDTLEDIFRFVASSKFFNKAIYQLEGRNHSARTRDAKRKTYTEFLQWIEKLPESIPDFTEDFVHENGHYFNICMKCCKQFIGHKRRRVCKLCLSKDDYLPYLFSNIEGFEDKYNTTANSLLTSKKIKSKMSGKVVQEVVVLEGKELGEFMKWLKEDEDAKYLFTPIVFWMSDYDIRNLIKHSHLKWIRGV